MLSLVESCSTDATFRVYAWSLPVDGDVAPRVHHNGGMARVASISARRVLTAAGWRDDATVGIGADGLITAITPSPIGATPDVESLLPGFVDVQVNGVDDVDVAVADGDDWTRIGRLLAAQGVTTWCPTLITAPLHRYAPALARIRAARDAAAHGGTPLPSIAGVHLEGPFLGSVPGAHPPHLIRPPDLDWLADLPDHVCLVTLGAEQPGAVEATRLLVDRGVLVSIGHSAPSGGQFDACVAAGARMVTHLFNGMSGLHHRTPGLAAFALADDRVAAGLIADGVHVDATMMRLAWRARPDGVVLVTDAVAWRAGTVGEIGLALRDGAPRLPDGTLAGSSLTMDAALRRTVHEVGIDLADAVAAASGRPARLLGLHDRGVIAPGRRADLVALTDDLTVQRTWVRGEPVA